MYSIAPANWAIDSSIRPNQVLPLGVRVDLGVMTIKGYLAFPIAPTLLKSYIILLSAISRHSLTESYPSSEKQSVYPTAPAD